MFCFFQLLIWNLGFQLDVFQVEERGFYLRMVCKMGEGVAMSLYKVLESLTSFNIQSSNLASASDRFILTATINVITFLWFELKWLEKRIKIVQPFSCQVLKCFLRWEFLVASHFLMFWHCNVCAGERLWGGHELAKYEALAYWGTS